MSVVNTVQSVITPYNDVGHSWREMVHSKHESVLLTMQY